MKQLARVFNRRPVYRQKSIVDWPLPDQLIGLEIEAENIKGIQQWPDDASLSMYWKRVPDGSLQRGNEYVLLQPVSGSMLGGAIQAFFSSGKLVRDPAGSTHIHLNMMDEDDTVDGLRNLCILMYLFEELLFVVGDPGRAACGYTNRLITAPERILRTIFSPELDEKPQLLAHVFAHSSNSRYYGFNMQALGKHGTVEFRYFPTATSAEELTGWIKLLMSFKKAAVQLGSVVGIESMLANENNYVAFVNEHFGQWYEQFLATTPYEQARRTMNTLRAMNSGICQPQDANVSIEKLKNSKRFSKFFTRVKKEEASPPVVRPDKIHAVNGNTTLPDRVEGFDRTLKHIMLYDSSMYVWLEDNGGWIPVDGYGIYNRLSGGMTSRTDDYVTWDTTLIEMMREEVTARRDSGELTPRRYDYAMLTIRELADWIVNIVQFYRSGGKLKRRADGVYRIKHVPLQAIQSVPEDSSAFETSVSDWGDPYRPGPDDYDEDEEEEYEEEEEEEGFDEQPVTTSTESPISYREGSTTAIQNDGGTF